MADISSAGILEPIVPAIAKSFTPFPRNAAPLPSQPKSTSSLPEKCLAHERRVALQSRPVEHSGREVVTFKALRNREMREFAEYQDAAASFGSVGYSRATEHVNSHK